MACVEAGKEARVIPAWILATARREGTLASWFLSAGRLLLGAVRSPTFMALLAIVVVRVATLGSLALLDNTEARYAWISWRMQQTGNWVTPEVYYHGELLPFWGKPPLFFWLTALSFRVCGVSEWAARLPNLLLGAATVAATMELGARIWNRRVAQLAGLILSSSGMFFVLCGACVVDVALAAALAAAMLTFARTVSDARNRNRWGYGFFLSIAVGCLAKGPLAIVLAFLPIGAWAAVTRQWGAVRQLPWIRGICAAALVAAPWYVAAERATPGFLHYFLVREHILRYLSTDYGDLYGKGRIQPYGASWFFLLVSFLPWTPVLLTELVNRWWRPRERNAAPPVRDIWLAYLLCWGLVPPIFFTFCRQLLGTYLLPALPALALVAAARIDRRYASRVSSDIVRVLKQTMVVTSVILAACFAAALWQSVPADLLVGAVLIAAIAGGLAWRGWRPDDEVSLVGAASVAVTLIIGLSIATFRPLINEACSTREILSRLSEERFSDSSPLLLPFGDEWSADFYQEAHRGCEIVRHHERGEEFLSKQALRGDPHVLLLVPERKWNEAGESLRSRFEIVTNTPHWVACRVAVRGATAQ